MYARRLLCLAILSAGIASSESCYQASPDPNRGATNADRGGIAEAEYVDALVEAQIALADRCCQQAGLGAARRHDSNARSRVPMPDQAAMASYDPRAAAACVAEFAQRECPLLKAPPHEPSACDDVYARGNRQVGEPCQTSYECAQAPGMLTGCAGASVGEGIDGSCVNYEWAGEGESCHSDRRGISVRCEGALVCDNQRGICMRRAEHGESCLSWPTFGDTCAPGSVCDHEGSGRCVAPIPVGEPCGPDIEGQCEGFACIHDACREPLSHANFVTCEG